MAAGGYDVCGPPRMGHLGDVLAFVSVGSTRSGRGDFCSLTPLIACPRCYRCGSTWFLSMLIHWTLAVNLVFGSMRAHDMRTPISVDTNFTLTMAIINGTCTLTVAVVMGLSAFSKRIHWPYPTLATSTARSMTSKQRETQRLRQRRGSKVAPQALPADGPAPINVCGTAPDMCVRLQDVLCLLPLVRGCLWCSHVVAAQHHQAAVEEEMVWVSTLMRSKAEIAQSQLSLPELVNVHQLDSTIVQLREFWRQARDAKCVLAWSIMEAMDDVSALVEVCRPVSYLPNPALASMMPAMVARLRRRADRLALVSPQKRRIFLKLLAFRSWIGDRVFERIEMGMKRTVSVRCVDSRSTGWRRSEGGFRVAGSERLFPTAHPPTFPFPAAGTTSTLFQLNWRLPRLVLCR